MLKSYNLYAEPVAICKCHPITDQDLKHGLTWLRITRLLPMQPLPPGETRNEEVEESDNDAEALLRTSVKAIPASKVLYDIVHSRSYQVPVLYITFQHSRVVSLNEVYDFLVPQSHQSQLKTVGTMGGLSMAEHPMNGMPAYFVHPCQTAEAVQTVVGAQTLGPLEHILLWLGVIGGSVGLNMPVDMACQTFDSNHSPHENQSRA